jgi:hypothetical protein
VAISTLADFKAALAAPHQTVYAVKQFGNTNGIQGLISSWLEPGKAGTAPTTAAACDKSTTGALANFTNAGGSNKLRAIARSLYPAWALTGNISNQTLIVMDRLCHQGGISGTATGDITTNLPTAALPRFTDGKGVMAFAEIYTAIGTTATTARITYTNQDGTGSKVSQDFSIGGASGANTGRAAGTLYAIGLADGDTGVRSVQSINVTASTGTAGAYGITLARPLFILSAPQLNQSRLLSLFGGGGCACPVPNDACLMLVSAGQSATPAISGAIGMSLELYNSTT